jgi:hypothetical protein
VRGIKKSKLSYKTKQHKLPSKKKRAWHNKTVAAFVGITGLYHRSFLQEKQHKPSSKKKITGLLDYYYLSVRRKPGRGCGGDAPVR